MEKCVVNVKEKSCSYKTMRNSMPFMQTSNSVIYAMKLNAMEVDLFEQ